MGPVTSWEAAKRVMFVYLCILLTVNVIISVTGSFQINASSERAARNNELRTHEIRASQREGCERSNDIRVYLTVLGGAVKAAPGVPESVTRALDRYDDRVAPVDCEAKYPPLP